MSTTRTEVGILEFTYSYNEWRNFKALIDINDGSVASALQIQIEYGHIKTLDEAIQWSHLGERILKGEKEPEHQYIKGVVLNQKPSFR